MPSDRITRRIDALLDEADAAVSSGAWTAASQKARAVLAIDKANEDALAFLKMAEANGAGEAEAPALAVAPIPIPSIPGATTEQPKSFAGSRYEVRRFLGEGGKKRVFLAHDTRLDRDVAFALIKTAGLDDVGRERIIREAQAMGRLGAHPNIVTIFEMGEEGGSPFVVNELLAGGDVESEMEKAAGPLLLGRTLEIARGVCRGLAFAHERGIVHRDLKPGNVWLTTDGTAKIGDFGLAVSLERSRLTQHGMMVGTVAYMPPEQALGGEVTPQADLYSLGAMLYELVTGRPPFQADDPTAVISQHINIAPVSPSWLSDHCPPDLEDLILRLLAKVPSDRPKSASEVLAVLETVDPEGKSASHSDSGANPLDRLARGVFVGREKELERLRAAFDDAFAGRGGLVMLVGEPGIGKTRTAQELETYARMRGAQVLWGGSHEGSGAPPYWPWVQAGRQWGSANDQAAIREEMAPSRGELSRLFPELRNNPGFVEPEPVTDPESAQFLLFDAVALFIGAMQRRTPIVIALDDLHWADKPTLLLLQHVARELSHLRVLVLCTYRDTDLSRTHPLSEALATLNRDPGFQRIVLRGLSKDEVASYIRSTANVEPKAEVVGRIFEETEGNPFFLSEVVNLLTQEGTLGKDSLSDIAVPDGVKEALGRRLDRLSEEANAFLRVAAIVGREFAYDTLNLLGEREEDDLLKLVEEGIEARVIEELPQPGRYRFTHALMQETLLSELSITRRVRLHGQVGEALEKRWGSRADERAPRLAEHFMESSMLNESHAQRAVHYAKLAAQQAEAQTAWNEAAKWYESVLGLVTAAEDGLGEDEAELLWKLGVSYRYETNFRSAIRSYRRAIDIFRERGDGDAVARVVISATHMPRNPVTTLGLVDDGLAAVGDNNPRLRAILLAMRSQGQTWDVGTTESGAAQLAEAENLLGNNEWPDVAGYLFLAKGNLALRAGDFDSAAEHCRRAHRGFAASGNMDQAGLALMLAAATNLGAGRVTEAEAALAEALRFCEEQRLRFQVSNTAVTLAGVYALRADIDGFERAAAKHQQRWTDICKAKLLGDLGDLDAAEALLPDPGLFPFYIQKNITGERLRLGVLAGLRTAVDASAGFGEWLETALTLPSGWARNQPLAHADQAVAALASSDQARAILEALCDPPGYRFTAQGAHSLDRFRGDLALQLGQLVEAEKWYQLGFEICTRERCPVELGRCHQGLAAIAEKRGDTAGAREHLDLAGELFSKHGAKLFLDQVLKKKEFLKA